LPSLRLGSTTNRSIDQKVVGSQIRVVGEVIQHRLEQYHEKTEPLIDYCDEKGLLRRIDGTPSPDEVGDRIRALLATLKMEEDTDL